MIEGGFDTGLRTAAAPRPLPHIDQRSITTKPTRRHAFKVLGLALAIYSLSLPGVAHADGDDDDGFRADKVFTSTNAVAGNELLATPTRAAA